MPMAYPTPTAPATPAAMLAPAYTPGTRLPAFDGGTRVWPFRFADFAPTEAALAPAERARAARYLRSDIRTKFVVGRGVARAILGDLLGRSPAEVCFEVAVGGKPTLADCGWHFNLSHAGGIGLLAVSTRPAGVDLEELRPVPNAAGLVERYFARQECEAFAALPQELQLPGFFRAWTCKEALLKATGRGLIDLEACVVELDPRRPPAAIRYDGGPWELTCFTPAPGFVAALAVQSTA